MHSFLKQILLLFLSCTIDIFYFLSTGTITFHLTLCSFLYMLFQKESFWLLSYAILLLGIESFVLYHSYTLYYLSCLPWAIMAYFIRHYMGRKDFYLMTLITCTLLTHSLLLYFSIFKPMITPSYTFSVISCNLLLVYVMILKFPIVEQGNRL